MNRASQHPFYGFVARHFHRLFWPVLAGTLILMFLQLDDQRALTTGATPAGIISLEIGNYRADTAIIASWIGVLPVKPADNFCEVKEVKRTQLQVAHANVWGDFLFILFYTALFVVILATLQFERKAKGAGGSTGFSHLLVILALAAGCCDVIEDIGLLRFIDDGLLRPIVNGKNPCWGSVHWALLTRTMAFTKFGLLMGLSVYILFVLIFRHYGLQWLSAYIRVKALQLFRFRLILLGIAFFAGPIWILDQGQDLLVNTNAWEWGVVLFLIVVFITALLNWYLAKLFFASQYVPPFWPLDEPVLNRPLPPDKYLPVLRSEKKVSRYLGISTILLPGVAILNALAKTRLHYFLDQFSPMAWLVGLLALFFVLVQQNVAEKSYVWFARRYGRRRALSLLIVLLLLLMVGLPALFLGVFIRHREQSPQSLNFLFLDMVLFALAFYVFVSVRMPAFKTTGLLGLKIGRLILPAAALMALFFIVFNVFPFVAQAVEGCFLSLPVVLSGIVFYTLAITLVMRWGQKKSINFLFFIFVGWLLLVINSTNNFHAVHRISVKTRPASPKMRDYFKEWVLAREAEIERDTTKTYPVFLVNSYGGGIRAAAFTNFALSYLDDSLLRRDSAAGLPRHGFEHYVFALSGASGGTVGSAIQCAFRATHPDSMRSDGRIVNPYTNFRDSFEHFYRHDFLTPTLAGILGRDMFSPGLADGLTALKLPLWEDRAAIQDELWARYGLELGVHLDVEFNSLWDPRLTGPLAYDIPLLFANTLNIDDGVKGICAPVTLDTVDFKKTLSIRDRIDSLNASAPEGEDNSMSISLITGAFLSARFPYISPTGKMGPNFHFLDGGGKDNSGASTSAALFFALSRYIREEMDTSKNATYVRLLKRLRLYFVSISNSATSTLDIPPPDEKRKVVNRFEPLNPLVGIINSGINGNAMEADSALRSRFKGNPYFASVYGGYYSVWPNTFCINKGTDSAYCPLAPLGWQISEPSLKRMVTNFTLDSLARNPEGVLALLRVEGLR